MGLHGYQRSLLRRFRKSKARRSLIVLPPGTGKTHVAAAEMCAVARAGGSVLFLAHRKEILNQTVRRLRAAGVPAKQIGIIRGGAAPTPSARIQVASVLSLAKRATVPPADLVVVDEAHRTLAASYLEILRRYLKARVMGLTATPERLDGKPLAGAYDELLEGPSPEWLIARGHLARGRYFTVAKRDLPNLSGLHRSDGDFSRAALARRVTRRELFGNILRHWKRRARNLSTIVFAVSIAHARSIERRFRDEGVSVARIDKDTSTDERDRIAAALRSGDIQVVVNCEILAEGFDAPNVRCVVMARPTLSKTLYLQQVGRALRPGRRPVILDHAGNVVRLRRPEEHRAWSLTREEKRPSVAARRECACATCFAVFAYGISVCPECGRTVPKRSRVPPKENEKELVELRSLAAANGVPIRVAQNRVRMLGWDPVDAVTVPWRKQNRRREWAAWSATARQHGVSAKRFGVRLAAGWGARKSATTAPIDVTRQSGRSHMSTAQRKRWAAYSESERAAVVDSFRKATRPKASKSTRAKMSAAQKLRRASEAPEQRSLRLKRAWATRRSREKKP